MPWSGVPRAQPLGLGTSHPRNSAQVVADDGELLAGVAAQDVAERRAGDLPGLEAGGLGVELECDQALPAVGIDLLQ